MKHKPKENPFEDGDDAKFVKAKKHHKRKVITQELKSPAKGHKKMHGKGAVKKVVVK